MSTNSVSTPARFFVSSKTKRAAFSLRRPLRAVPRITGINRDDIAMSLQETPPQDQASLRSNPHFSLAQRNVRPKDSHFSGSSPPRRAPSTLQGSIQTVIVESLRMRWNSFASKGLLGFPPSEYEISWLIFGAGGSSARDQFCSMPHRGRVA